MQQENGRLEPAEKAEIANLKGKHMQCPKCGEKSVFANVKFADTTCGRCGAKLVDDVMSGSRKITG